MIGARTTASTAYDASITANPYFWSALVGFLIGIVINVGTRRRLPALTRWTIVSFLLSAAIVIALAGAFLSGPSTLVDIRLVPMLGFSVMIVAVGTRFPRAAGIPLIAMTAVATLALLVELRSWDDVRTGEPFLSFSLRARSDEELSIVLSPGGPNQDARSGGEVFGAAGTALTFELETLRAAPYWFFGDRYARLLSPRADPLVPGTFLASWGWKYAIATSEPVSPIGLYTYLLYLDGSTAIRVERAASSP